MSRHVTFMTIDDAEHYTPEEREAIVAAYPPHEREARAKGIPVLGSGRVFPVSEESITVPPFELPAYWACIGAIDFGWEHPTAAVKVAWDRDADIVYVVQSYRQSHATPLIHAEALKPWGKNLPFAWPHDGLNHEKGSGEQLSVMYRSHGVAMRHEQARFEDGSNSVEAGIALMLERMQSGRFKVFAHLADWFEEFRLYHRKDGKIVKVRDDLMDATRYALMNLRFATAAGPKVSDRYRRPPSRSGGSWMAA